MVQHEQGHDRNNAWFYAAQGRRYWQMEREMSAAMSSHRIGTQCDFSVEEVLAASEAKSFDYRVRRSCAHVLNLTFAYRAICSFHIVMVSAA